MLKIALGQMEVIPGRPDLNTATMLEMIQKAKKRQAQIVIFPEMSIPGYFLGDTWEQEAFLHDCEEYGRSIIAASQDIVIIFGNIAIDWNKKGDDGRVRKYNAFFAAQNGQLQGGENFLYPYRIKTLQPNYREFDDTRHFYSLCKLAIELGQKIESLLQPIVINIQGQQFTIGGLLCEDGWSDDYAVKPIELLNKNHKIDLFINISSSPFTLGKNNKRNRVFSKEARETSVPLIYVNNIGIQNNGKTVYTFDGSSTVYDKDGEVIRYCEPFQPMLGIVNFNGSLQNNSDPIAIHDDQDISSIYQALAYGTTKFLASIGMEKVVVGVSGGIDSAVVAALYTSILGPENVLLINMPSVYNSQTTKDLATKLAHNLGCFYAIFPIQNTVDFTINQINNTPINTLDDATAAFKLSVSSFVAENIQARDRSSRVLAGVAAAFGGGFTCNANKSEMTVGYSTLYGDQAGFLACLADLWKHQVYALADYINQTVYQREIIPQETIDIVPSAELSAEQAVDQGKGDPLVYPYHDYLFKAFMEDWNKATPEDILNWYSQGILEQKVGCQSGIVNQIFSSPAAFIADLERWWKLYTGMGIAKRIQAPPVIAVSRRAYGFDHREAQNGIYFTSKYLKLKEKILKNM